MNDRLSADLLKVTLTAFGLLLISSFVDWEKLTGDKLSNYNLFGDVYEWCGGKNLSSEINDNIDPALDAAITELNVETELSLDETTISEEIADMENPEPINYSDVVTPVERRGNVWPIEDYSITGDGIENFRNAIASADSKRCRIAVIGDSYIEGDIFTQDIRRLLQNEYGGKGVGYMSMHSDFPGFRRSVMQNDKGWNVYSLRDNSNSALRLISGEYCIGSVGSTASFKGSKIENAENWNVSRLLYKTTKSGSVEITTDSISRVFDLTSSPDIQMIEMSGPTAKMVIKSNCDSLVVIGAWLESETGIGVDCMSVRGNSGVGHRSLSQKLASEMNSLIPYDLIIVEYGMNALSAEQTDYTNYGRIMEKVINRLKECYPQCDILMLGVGDRGQKNGTSITSMSTIDAMVAAQRQCARNCNIMFWDTRQAMGGADAICRWRNEGLVNADYIHLNHKGGGVLAKELILALKMKLDEKQ